MDKEFNMLIPTTAGVILTNGQHILLCHPTGQGHFDLPKGKIDPGEDEIDCAIRELDEEAGIVVSRDNLSSLGIFPYKKGKVLSLWLYKVSIMPDISKLFCHSTFDNGKGMMKFEMDGYQLVPWTNIKEVVVPSMYKVLLEVQKLI